MSKGSTDYGKNHAFTIETWIRPSDMPFWIWDKMHIMEKLADSDNSYLDFYIERNSRVCLKINGYITCAGFQWDTEKDGD